MTRIDLSEEQRSMVEKNMPLVGFTMGKFFGRYFSLHPEDFDDMQSISYVALCKAAYYYKPENGAFSSFAVKGICEAIRKEFRARHAYKRGREFVTISLNDANYQFDKYNDGRFKERIDMLPDENVDVEGDVLDGIIATDLMEKAKAAAPTLWLYCNGDDSQREIAAKQGVSKQAVGWRIKNEARRLRAEIQM